MTTNMYFINLRKSVQIGCRHHVDFCVWWKSAIIFGEGCMLKRIFDSMAVNIIHQVFASIFLITEYTHSECVH